MAKLDTGQMYHNKSPPQTHSGGKAKSFPLGSGEGQAAPSRCSVRALDVLSRATREEAHPGREGRTPPADDVTWYRATWKVCTSQLSTHEKILQSLRTQSQQASIRAFLYVSSKPPERGIEKPVPLTMAKRTLRVKLDHEMKNL